MKTIHKSQRVTVTIEKKGWHYFIYCTNSNGYKWEIWTVSESKEARDFARKFADMTGADYQF